MTAPFPKYNNEAAVIYARYSDGPDQTENSIEGQLRECHEFAARSGLLVVGEYIDRAISGRSADRPDFLRMIEDARKSFFSVVIVWKLDRFARNRFDSAIYRKKLKECGVRLLSAREPIGEGAESIILEGMLEAFAEYYSANLAENVKRGLRQRVLDGHFVGGSPPFGYSLQDGVLTLDEGKAEVMRWAFRAYADGRTKQEIAEAFNARGYRNARGQPFTCKSFVRTFANPAYIGKYRAAGMFLPCPAVIDEETFERVQRRIESNRRRGARNKAKVEYLLSGKLFCGHCGSAMTGLSGTSKGGTIYNYYACFGRRRKNGCKKKHERKDFIEWYVCEQALSYILDPSRLSEIARRVVAAYNADTDAAKARALEKKIAQRQRDIDRAAEALIFCPAGARASICQKIEELTALRDDAQADLNAMHRAARLKINEQQVIDWLRSFYGGDPADVGFQKILIDKLVNAVFLWDDRILIFYNVAGGREVSYIDALALSQQFDEQASLYSDASAPPVVPEFKFLSGFRLIAVLSLRGATKRGSP